MTIQNIHPRENMAEITIGITVVAVAAVYLSAFGVISHRLAVLVSLAVVLAPILVGVGLDMAGSLSNSGGKEDA